jgi:hypothetical protein
MLEYGDAVPVRPVVQYFGEYEDGDVLLPCRLWCKEVVTFLFFKNPKRGVCFNPNKAEEKRDEP